MAKNAKKPNENKPIKLTKDGKYSLDPGICKKLTKAQREALRLKAKYPGETDKDISLRLKDKGLTTDSNYLAVQKSQNKNMANELQRIQEVNMHYLATRIVPKAMELHEEALHDKRMSKNDRFKWVKLGEDSYFKQLDRPVQIQQMNVNVAAVQNFISESMQKGPPVIDVTGEDNDDEDGEDDES